LEGVVADDDGRRRRQEVDMSHKNMGPYVVAAAIVAAALILAGVPFATLLPFALVLLCPLMMVFMMRGMSHGSGTEGDKSQHEDLGQR
jgi:hypothetical protein